MAQLILHPEFSRKVMLTISDAIKEGLKVDIHAGYRSFAEQSVLFNKRVNGKRVTRANAGESWHNYGLAVDLVFKEDGEWSWAEKHDWKKLGAIGKKNGLEWGGDWKTFPDRPHFQMINGQDIHRMKDLYIRTPGEFMNKLRAVWYSVDPSNM